MKVATTKKRRLDQLAINYVVLAFPMLLFSCSVWLRSGRLLHTFESPGRRTERSRMDGGNSRSDQAVAIACKQGSSFSP
jgi:hypothetical protein